MSRWRWGRRGTVSWSIVALWACLVALVVLGLTYWVPSWRATGQPEIVEPGLLQVAQAARVEVALQPGYAVAMTRDGLRVSFDGAPLLDTTTRGSLATVVHGSVSGTTERIDAVWPNLAIDSAVKSAKAVEWRGVAFGAAGRSGPSTQVRVVVSQRPGGPVQITMTAVGADALALHFDWRPDTTGVPPALPARNLRTRAWWVTGDSAELFTTVLGGRVGVAAPGHVRVVDLRPDGRTDVHAWASEVVVTVVKDR